MTVLNPVLQPVLRRVTGDVFDPLVGGYQTFATVYDGTNDYQLRGAGLTGAADGQLGVLAGRFRFDGPNATFNMPFSNTGETIELRRSSSNQFDFFGENSAGTGILRLTSSTGITSRTAFYNLLMSWDLGNGIGHLYVDDVDDLQTSTLTDDTIDYTVANWSVGARVDGSFPTDGAISEFYFCIGKVEDFSVVANRRRYFDANGNPVYKGVGGEQAAGIQPIVYIPDGGVLNRGSGGPFTTTGAPELIVVP